MTSERILNAVAAFLRTKVEAAGGVFAVSETVANTLSLLSGSPGRWRVILQYQRGEPGGARGVRKMTMLIIVQHGGQNLAVHSGDAVSVKRVGDEEALLQRCTQVCKWARSINFKNQDIAQDWPQMQQGADYWLNDPSFPTRQIAHEFTVNFAQDGVTTEEVTVA